MSLSRGASIVPLPDAGRDLFAGLIDDARLLADDPPDMGDLVASYRDARRRTTAVWLGRLVCPATRLIELAGALTATMEPGDAPWPITVVVDGTVGAAATAIQSFDTIMSPAARIELAATPTPAGASVAVIQETANHAATALAALPVAVAACCNNAGDPPTIARSIVACRHSGVPCLATGLGHVVPAGGRPGIVNVMVAHALAAAGASATRIEAAVRESNPGAFALSRAVLSWNTSALGTGELHRLRSTTLLAVAATTPDSTITDVAAFVAEPAASEHRDRPNL